MAEGSFYHPHIEDSRLSAFAEHAEAFCLLVDSRQRMDRLEFIHQLHLGLADLYSAGLRLPPTSVLYKSSDSENDAGYSARYDLGRDETEHSGTWRDLYSDLNDYFGEKTYYREIFDPYEPVDANPEVMGSLADDIADIYRDLAQGLSAWRDGNSGAALWEWRFGFEHHWGEHATGALRALHCRAAWHDTWFPPSA